MAFETEITTLGSSPVDLHDGVNPDAPTGEWRAVENTGTTALLYRESAAIPVLGGWWPRSQPGRCCGAAGHPVAVVVGAGERRRDRRKRRGAVAGAGRLMPCQ